MNSMKSILIVYGVILSLGILTLITKVHYFANIAGFIAAMGFLLVFFKDPVENQTETEKAISQKYKLCLEQACYSVYYWAAFGTTKWAT